MSMLHSRDLSQERRFLLSGQMWKWATATRTRPCPCTTFTSLHQFAIIQLHRGKKKLHFIHLHSRRTCVQHLAHWEVGGLFRRFRSTLMIACVVEPSWDHDGPWSIIIIWSNLFNWGGIRTHRMATSGKLESWSQQMANRIGLVPFWAVHSLFILLHAACSIAALSGWCIQKHLAWLGQLRVNARGEILQLKENEWLQCPTAKPPHRDSVQTLVYSGTHVGTVYNMLILMLLLGTLFLKKRMLPCQCPMWHLSAHSGLHKLLLCMLQIKDD